MFVTYTYIIYIYKYKSYIYITIIENERMKKEDEKEMHTIHAGVVCFLRLFKLFIFLLHINPQREPCPDPIHLIILYSFKDFYVMLLKSVSVSLCQVRKWVKLWVTIREGAFEYFWVFYKEKESEGQRKHQKYCLYNITYWGFSSYSNATAAAPVPITGAKKMYLTRNKIKNRFLW